MNKKMIEDARQRYLRLYCEMNDREAWAIVMNELRTIHEQSKSTNA